MPKVGPEHTLNYRQEVVKPLFEAIKAGDSCAIIGPSSMGKSRLLQFIMRADVQQQYLGESAPHTLLVQVDCNRLAAHSDWGLYELLLTALTEACGQHPALAALRSEFNKLRGEAIVSRDAILAQRHLELAVYMACREQGLHICLLLDEFDELYRSLPTLAFANLRAMRDANKYHLFYTLLLREHPAHLRPPADCEGFYELFSRAVLGLKPYARGDAEQVVMQLEARKGFPLAPAIRNELLNLSGGHPGMLVALVDALRDGNDVPDTAWTTWASANPNVQDECAKIWASLSDRERLALSQHARSMAVNEAEGWRILQLKGLVRNEQGSEELFSPIFARFILTQAAPFKQKLWVDEATRVVWIGERAVRNLTAREFDLIAFLYERIGEVRSREHILKHLYPQEVHDADIEGQDNRVDTLVKRAREKIEPIRTHPCYLLTARGKGYQLVATPSTDPFMRPVEE